MKKYKIVLLFSFMICFSGILTAWVLGFFAPEWKEYSLESPYVNEFNRSVSRKSKGTKLDSLYETLGLKGLVYQFLQQEQVGGEDPYDATICSIDVYSITDLKSLEVLNQNALPKKMKENIHPSAQFQIESEIDKSDFHKSIRKITKFNSIWMPASTVFALNAENFWEMLDENGRLVANIQSSKPNQWKHVERCLDYFQQMDDPSGKKVIKATINDNILTEKSLYNNQQTQLVKEKIKQTILSDHSFVRMDDMVVCDFNYDPQGVLDDRYSHPYWKDKPKLDVDTSLKRGNYTMYENYKKHGKAFDTWQYSDIGIYNADEKIYIRMYASYRYRDEFPYIAKYCEE